MLKKRIISSVFLLTCMAITGCSSDSNFYFFPSSNSTTPITTASPSGNIQAKIGSVTINSPPVVTFALSDENGKPLNPKDMIAANSSNRFRFYIARLDDKGRYVNYIKNAAGTAPSYDGNDNASAIPGRIAEVSPGVYTYTFTNDIKDSTKTFQHFSSASMLGKKATTFDATKTHTVVAQILRKGTKNGKAFDQVVNPYINFRPDGGTVTTTREIAPISGCNNCHGVLAIHGGSRIEMALCIVCHTAGVTEDGTSATASVDMKEMVHNIHMGKAMPDKAYFKTSTFSAFSTMTYPVFSRDSVINSKPVDCSKCHTAGKDTAGLPYGKDVAKYLVASAENCNSCHNTTAYQGETTLTVNGVSGVAATAHTGGTVSSCGCHAATGAEYDNSVPGSHTVWEKAKANPGINAKVIGATNAIAGSAPVVTVQLTDNAGKAITWNDTTIKLAIYYPVKAFGGADFLNATGGSAGSVSATSANTTSLGNGKYAVDFKTTNLPSTVTDNSGNVTTVGTVAFVARALRTDTTITHRGVTSTPSSDAAITPQTIVYYDLVTGNASADVVRRQVVDDEKCKACHNTLPLHSTSRSNAFSCTICHNPNKNEADFKYMIHKYHSGKDAEGTYRWDISKIGYPNNRIRCIACHIDPNPVPTATQGTRIDKVSTTSTRTDARYLATIFGAATTAVSGATTGTGWIPYQISACISCHDSSTAISHAYTNRTVDCTGCHSDSSRQLVHQPSN